MKLSRLSNRQLRRLLRKGEVRFASNPILEGFKKAQAENRKNLPDRKKAASLIQQAINKVRLENYTGSGALRLVDWGKIDYLMRWFEDNDQEYYTMGRYHWRPSHLEYKLRNDEILDDLKKAKKKVLDEMKERKYQ